MSLRDPGVTLQTPARDGSTVVCSSVELLQTVSQALYRMVDNSHPLLFVTVNSENISVE